MFQTSVTLSSLLLTLLIVADPARASVEHCRDTVARASARLARQRARILGLCEARVVRNALAPDTDCATNPRTARRLALADAALRRSVASACGGNDRTCGSGGDDESLAAVGWDSGACPGVLGSSCTMPIEHCGDLADCLTCASSGASGSWAVFWKGDRIDPIEPGIPRCQRAIVNATAAYLAANTPNARDNAENRMRRKICRACGGADHRCDDTVGNTPGSGGGDDALPKEIGLPAVCPQVTPPGSDASCQHAISSLSDAIECLTCTARYRAECTALAANPSGGALPQECLRAPICEPGYTGFACNQLRPEVVPELAALPEPQQWLTDKPTGRRYRRATRQERVRYGWLPGTYLVEAPNAVGNAKRGIGPIFLLVPTGDDQVHRIALDLAHAATGPQAIELSNQGGKARAKTTQPVFFNFLSHIEPKTSFEALVHLLAVENGGAKINGMAGTHKIDGYLSTRPLSLDAQLAPPNGLDTRAIAVISIINPDADASGGWNDCHGEGICGAFCDNQGITAPCSGDSVNPCCQPYDPDGIPADDCHDGFDNDGDGQIDVGGNAATGAPADTSCAHTPECVPNGTNPSHSHATESGKQFILLGDIHLCSSMVDKGQDWQAELHTRAVHIVGGFREETGYAAWDNLNTYMTLRNVAIKCWWIDDVDKARECKDGSLADCAPFNAPPHLYPYVGAGNNASSYLGDYPRADMVHSVQVGLSQPVNLVQVLMATGTGQALIGATSPSVGGLTVGEYSVAKWGDTWAIESFNVSNHEIGHSFNLTHCDAELSPIDNMCTIMGDDHNTTGNCLLSDICNVADGHARMSPENAQQLYSAVRNGSAMRFHYGNVP